MARRFKASRPIRPGEPGYRRAVLLIACGSRGWTTARKAAPEVGCSGSHLYYATLDDDDPTYRRPSPELAERIAAFVNVPVAILWPAVGTTPRR